MKKNKACGPDGIATEIYQYSEVAKQGLFDILTQIIALEHLPKNMASSIFVPIYKKKDKNSLSNYRYIGLLNHSYKILTKLLLSKLIDELEFNLPDSQYGFRKRRSTDDAIFLLETAIRETVEKNSTTHITFIDFVAAFDSVGHKFMDEGLKKAGASDASRSMFRALYKNASGRIRLRNNDGSHSYSEPFQIRRGCIQGDILSPYYFIIAIMILLECDPLQFGSSFQFNAGYMINSLFFADDASFIDQCSKSLSERLTIFRQEALRRADMEISIPKTKAMSIMRSSKAPSTKQEDYTKFRKLLPHVCPNCNAGFPTFEGQKIHQTRWCDRRYAKHMSDKQTVVQIVACRGPPEQRSFLVQWDHEIIGSKYKQDLSKWFDHEQKSTNDNYEVKKVIGGPFMRLNEINEILPCRMEYLEIRYSNLC